MTPEEIELLSELTIIIPTYNRPLELERSIEYWRDLPVTVHVLDGSDRPISQTDLLPKLANIFFHHIPRVAEEDPQTNVMRRLTIGANLSRSKFSAVCSADDFYTQSGIVASLKVLKSRHDIDAVAGRVLTYEKKTRVHWHHKYVPRTNRTDLESDSISQKLLTGSSWFLYAICKTEIWQKFIQICYQEQKFTNSNDNAHEFMMYILCKAMFRTKYLDMIQLVRQDTVVGANVGANVPWAEFICDTKNFEDISAITSQLAKGFNLVTPKNEHENNLRLASELMRVEQVNADLVRKQPQAKGSFKSAIADIVFYFFPMFNVFADRPRRLKYLWRIPKYQYSAEQQQEVEEIEKLLLKPREELWLRVNT